MPLPASVVRLLPLVGAPLLHHLLPALGMRSAPIRKHLQDNKYMTYEKMKLIVLNVKRNEYLM
jgi:hypothetical protein